MKVLLFALLAAISYAQTDDDSNSSSSSSSSSSSGGPSSGNKCMHWETDTRECPAGTMLMENIDCAGETCEDSDEATCCLRCWDDPMPEGCKEKCIAGFNVGDCPEGTVLSLSRCDGATCDPVQDQMNCCNKCCTANHVSCTACQHSTTVAQQCKDTPDAVGCKDADNTATLPLGCQSILGLSASQVQHGVDVEKWECNGNTLTGTRYTTMNCEAGSEFTEEPPETYENIDQCAASGLVGDQEFSVTCVGDVATITLCSSALSNNCPNDDETHRGCTPNMCKDTCCNDSGSEAYFHGYWSKWSMKAECNCGTEDFVRYRQMEKDEELDWETVGMTCGGDKTGDGSDDKTGDGTDDKTGDGTDDGKTDNSNALALGLGIMSTIMLLAF